jgi:tripartite-type tricarboxylate transporter receptor subunit TctC
VAPAGTPAAMIEKLNAEINAVLKMPDVRASLLRMGVDDTMSMSTKEFASFVAGEAKKWPPIIKTIGLKPG